MELPPHSLNRARRPDVVIKLSETGQDRLHEIALRVGIDRFCDGHDANPVFHQDRLDVEVVAYVAREAVHFPDQ